MKKMFRIAAIATALAFPMSLLAQSATTAQSTTTTGTQTTSTLTVKKATPK